MANGRTPRISVPKTVLVGALLAAALSFSMSVRPQSASSDETNAVVGTLDADRLSALRRARDTMIAVRDYAAALGPADNVVAADGKAPAADQAGDLAVLGRVEAELGKLDDAEARYLKAIDLLTAAEGQFSISLVNPYRGLGRLYIKAGRYRDAIAALETAQNVSQRNLGLFNIDQTPLIDEITTAYLGLGDTVQARRMQESRLNNAVRRFGADDPRVVAFRYELADYYERSRLDDSAREQYQEALKSQEQRLGTSDPGLLDPLRRLLAIDLATTQGKNAEVRERLETIVSSNPDVDPLERGLSLAALGDWATVTGDAATAAAYYRRAWQALGSKPGLDVAASFATPVALDFVPPLSAVDRSTRSAPYAYRQIVLTFDVSADGRPYNVKAVGDSPTDPMRARYMRRVRETHFRPRLVDGTPVDTTGVQLKHIFRDYVAAADVKQSDSAAEQ